MFYPTLDDTFSKGQYKELTFFFSVYPGSAPPTEAIVELLRYNQSLARTRIELPAPDSANRIQYASSIPISDYPAGTYTLKVLVPAGDKLVSRSSRFLLTE